MKNSRYIAKAAVSLLVAFGTLVGAGARAETYQGVHTPVSANNRDDVRAQAVFAAHRDNPYAEGVSSRVAPRLVASVDRASVHVEAVASALRPNPYAEGYGQGVASVSTVTLDRAALRAQARAASRGHRLPL